MPQFLIKKENKKDKFIEITQKSDIKHIIEVLRCKIGDIIMFIDEEEILYTSKLKEFTKDFLCAEIIKKEKSIRSLTTDITLVQSIIKSSAEDFIIQKATELGVKTIQPIITKFTVVKFENEKDKLKKMEKWQRIALESCKQCERSKQPIIKEIRLLEEVLNYDFDIKFACVERNANQSLKNFLKQTPLKKGQKIAVFVGPEGGWSDEELALFDKYNVAKVSLGNLILRAETAVISVLSGIIYEYED